MRSRSTLVSAALVTLAGLGLAGTNERVSVHTNGTEGDAPSLRPALSHNGRWVAFISAATTLVGLDTNGVADVFLRDRDADTTTRVSVGSGGLQGSGTCFADWDTDSDGFVPIEYVSVTPDGRYVSFHTQSAFSSLDVNGDFDVYVRDLQAGTTELVSRVTGGGNTPTGYSINSSISEDGRYVVFQSESRLAPTDADFTWWDVYLHDRQTGVTSQVSVSPSGGDGFGDSYGPRISGDGLSVAFESTGTNLVLDDGNGTIADVFLRDRTVGATYLISRDVGGGPADGPSRVPHLSRDGSRITFLSSATDIAAPGIDVNGAPDVFLHYFHPNGGVSIPVSLNAWGQTGDGECFAPDISRNGRWVVYVTTSDDIVSTGNCHYRQLLRYDANTGTTRWIVKPWIGDSNYPCTTGQVNFPSVSANGDRIAFQSLAWNIVTEDDNYLEDVFVRWSPRWQAADMIPR